MELNEFQALALRTWKTTDKESESHHALHGILSEAGEVADALKKHYFYGQVLDVDNVKEELGDIMYYIATLAHVHGFSLSECGSSCIDKLKRRYPNGFTEEDAKARRDKDGEVS